jgi:hypothetical protein
VICEAISHRVLLEFDYDGSRRVVEPYCHGTSRVGNELLRAIQLDGPRFGKLFAVSKMRDLRLTDRAFIPNDPNYNPNDSAMSAIHCRI